MLVEFFVGSRAIHAFVLDGSTGELTVRRLADVQERGWSEFSDLVAGEGTDGSEDPETVLERIARSLKHPAMQQLTGVLDDSGARQTFLVPHKFLHAVPLNLIRDLGGRPASRPRTFSLPSASLLRESAPASWPADGRVIVAGDPTGDLEFARVECLDVGRRFGVEPAMGRDVTAEWLAEQLQGSEAPLRLVHLACHAAFDRRRPERSGIVLAVRPEDQERGAGNGRRLMLAELAQLDWGGALVVLSACSSGQQQVRPGDELAGLARAVLTRGARALIASLWRVPDLSTALVMSAFYDGLERLGSWDLDSVGSSFADAQQHVQQLTARELVATGAELRALAAQEQDPELLVTAVDVVLAAHRAAGNTDERLGWLQVRAALEAGRPPPEDWEAAWSMQPSITRSQAYEVRPFEDPLEWGAFVVMGAA